MLYEAHTISSGQVRGGYRLSTAVNAPQVQLLCVVAYLPHVVPYLRVVAALLRGIGLFA